MNVFVLSTGRCGSETFVRACEYMTNYSAAHESHNRWAHPISSQPYRDLSFPDQHIEADNRLSWMTGILDRLYGDRAYYVHLIRPRDQVARSLNRRGRRSILYAFAAGILQYYEDAHQLTEAERYEIALQYWDTVNDNIRLFLKDKPLQMTMHLDEIKPAFERFWHDIGAEGDLKQALAEWDVRHNPSRQDKSQGWKEYSGPVDERVQQSVDEICSEIPQDQMLILADEGQWGTSRVIRGRPCLPFTERRDRYWGPPESDAAAVHELQRLQGRGAAYFVLAWPAFWWRDVYASLFAYLDSECTKCLENERICIYRLSGRES